MAADWSDWSDGSDLSDWSDWYGGVMPKPEVFSPYPSVPIRTHPYSADCRLKTFLQIFRKSRGESLNRLWKARLKE